MNKKDVLHENDLLTSNQVTFMIVGIAIGVGFVRLPNVLVKHAYQDAWLSALIGLLYPTCILILSNYIIKKYPEENILQINRNFFGTIVGNILNILFMIPLFFYTFSVTSDYVNLILTYIVAFLNHKKIINISLLVVAYTAYKGLKPLSKANEYIGYMLIALMLVSLVALKKGNILNVQPVLQTPFKGIFKGSIEALYFFTGFESILLYHNKVKDKSSIKKASFKGLLISALVWIWVIFITIYYLGIDIIPKSSWSFIMVFESITLPVINNFRYIFMFQWILLCLRIISNFYYYSSFIMSDVFKINRKKLCIFMYIPSLFIAYKMFNPLIRNKLITILSPIFVLFNICLLSIVAIIAFIKSKNSSVPNTIK